MAVSEQELIEYAAELGKAGVPRKLIVEAVEFKRLNLPRPTASLYKGQERYLEVLREEFLLSLVRRCVGKKIGKRFKKVEDAVRHTRVCLQCQAEIINFAERIREEVASMSNSQT